MQHEDLILRDSITGCHLGNNSKYWTSFIESTFRQCGTGCWGGFVPDKFNYKGIEYYIDEYESYTRVSINRNWSGLRQVSTKAKVSYETFFEQPLIDSEIIKIAKLWISNTLGMTLVEFIQSSLG